MGLVLIELILFIILGRLPVFNIFNGYLIYRVIEKTGIKNSRIYLLVTFSVLLIITEFNFFALLSVLFGIAAYIILKLKGNFDFYKLISSIILIIFLVLTILNFRYIFNVDDVTNNFLEKVVSENKNFIMKNFSEMQLKSDVIIEPEKFIDTAIQNFVNNMLSYFFVYIFLGVVLPLLFYYNRYGTAKIKDIPDLNRIMLPEKLVWIFIILFGLNLLFEYNLIQNSLVFSNIVGNFFICVKTLYYFQGVLILSFYLKNSRTILPVLLVCLFFMYNLFVFLGVGDIWFDFRKLKTKKIDVEA